jgi:CubicO group peptidase (beta-lactamase class C family)
VSKTRRLRKIVILVAAVVTLAVLIGLGRYAYTAVPGGTGFVAKHLCSLVFVSGLDPERAMEIYVEPPIFPLAPFVAYEVDREIQTIRTSSFMGLVESEAAYRPGCGCTVLHDSTADELRAAFTPPVGAGAGLGLEFDADHRRLHFDETALEDAIDEGFVEPPGGGRNTLAVVVLHDGRLVAESYAPGIDAATPLPGWSMTKSVTATLVGILAREDRLDVDAPTGFPEWSTAGDPRGPITLDHLLRMTAGLEIFETQSGSDPNTVMLFMRPDGAAYSASRSPYTEPNTDFDYMSGCTVLASRLVREAVGGSLADAYNFVHDELFDPLGMATAELEPDESGTFIGSSFMLASARDWARFGQLYAQGGLWEDRRIVTEEWIDYVTTPTALSPLGQYGAGFWLNPDSAVWPGLPPDAFAARGFQGQTTFIIPSKKLVVVRLGASRVASGAHEIAAGIVASLRITNP